MVRDILFDLDDTLFDFHADERTALEKTFAKLKLPLDDAVRDRYSEINIAHWKALERGEINRAQVKIHRFRQLFDELGYPAEQAVLAAKIYHERLAEDFHFVEGASWLLEELSASGKYRLYLISNGSLYVQRGRLDRSGIEHYFAGIFISEMLGAEKPGREFFERVFEKIPDFDSEAAVVVGDSLTSDIKGGSDAGLRTIWFNPSEAPADSKIQADYELKSLKDLPELLRSL